MASKFSRQVLATASLLALILFAAGCNDGSLVPEAGANSDDIAGNDPVDGGDRRDDAGQAVLLVIDEDSIDNGNPPNDFSDVDVNDQKAALDMRDQLRFFARNTGRVIDLYTGDVGDEGWFALKRIPDSWRRAGPTDNGAQNYLLAGPGLGARYPDDDREVLLDDIRDVTPLRATGLTMLIGQTVLALVYDSDVSINYSPLMGSLKGETLGLVAFRVLEVHQRRDGSTGSLPRVRIEILDTDEVRELPLYLFANAPVPESSSEPYDIAPPRRASEPRLILAP
jgi:hypothetical protein